MELGTRVSLTSQMWPSTITQQKQYIPKAVVAISGGGGVVVVA